MMPKPFIRVLMVDDDEEDFLLTREMLERVNETTFTLKWAANYSAGLEQILAFDYDAVIVDYELGEQSGIAFVREAMAEGCTAPFMLYTGHGSLEVDVEAMHTGLAGYLPKSDATPLLLERTIRYAIERKEREAELRLARDQAKEKEERLQIALATTPLSVFTQDRDLRYTWANNPQFGFAPDQLLGKRDDEVFPPEEAASLTALKTKVIETGEGLKTGLDFHDRAAWSHVILALEPLFNDFGEVTGLTGAVLDRTEQYQMEARQFRHNAEMEVKRRLLEHREMERQEIARNLHDGPIQDLLCLLFPLQNAQNISENAQINQILEGMWADVQELVKNLRDLCNELRPPSLVAFGLEPAIRSHAQDFQSRNSHIQVNLDLVRDERLLSADQSLALFRIYQEAMNNAAHHARASQIGVRFGFFADQAVLEIHDNGVGFDLPEDFLTLARQQHFGLIGMKERAEGIGGALKIQSGQNTGTTLTISVPLAGA